MKKTKSNIDIYREAAKELGLKTEFVQSSPTKKVLLISNGQKFFLASASAPGFYPESRRWNAHFSGSKLLTQKILKRLGYKVISSKEIRVADYSSKKELVKLMSKRKYTFPVLVKPDKGIMGQGIAIADDMTQLLKIARNIYSQGNDFMIQPILNENEYRILVVNGEVLLMHSKHNPYVTGDGTSKIKHLLDKIETTKKDPTFIAWQLKKAKMTKNTVLPKGEQFEYHLTKKPTTVFYETKKFPAATKKWALKLAKDVNTPVVGIDVFIPKTFGDTASYTVIELNNNPGLNYLPTYCEDFETAHVIFKKVLRNYFKLK